jgi:Putative adhesin
MLCGSTGATMSTFWDTWRKEIIRGATLFCGVLAVGFFVHYLVARARSAVTTLPAVLRDLPNEWGADPGEEGGAARRTGTTWTVHHKMAPKQWVWIRNVRGTVTVEPTRGDSLRITAVKTYRSSDTARVRLMAVPYEGGITVCAVWPDNDENCSPGKEFHSGRTHGNDVAVDFTVRLPAHVGLGASTQVGDVRVTGASGPIVLTTVSGDVDAETAQGSVQAVSVNGSVHTRVRAFGDTGGVSVTTVNGSVTAELPQHLDADVQANTVNGSIFTDYPLTVEGRFMSHTLKGTVGRGGREVHIQTVNGSITIKKTT